jgi:hypothetical protein
VGPRRHSQSRAGRVLSPLCAPHRALTTSRHRRIQSRHVVHVEAAKIFFLNACNGQDVVSMIDEGVMICTGGGTAASTNGRQHTKRQMPW